MGRFPKKIVRQANIWKSQFGNTFQFDDVPISIKYRKYSFFDFFINPFRVIFRIYSPPELSEYSSQMYQLIVIIEALHRFFHLNIVENHEIMHENII